MSKELAGEQIAIPNRHFLHDLVKTTNRSYFGDEYEIAGGTWYGRDYGEHDNLSAHPRDNVIVDVSRAYVGDGFTWQWSLKIAEGVYVRHSGKSSDLESACAAAWNFSPRVLQFDYLTGITTWYETEPGSMYTVIDGEEASIRQYGEGNYRFDRNWAKGEPVFECLSAFNQALSGDAPTQEAAMIACIDAPDRFKRACAALVASLRDCEACHA